jgi:hypothetical protein
MIPRRSGRLVDRLTADAPGVAAQLWPDLSLEPFGPVGQSVQSTMMAI